MAASEGPLGAYWRPLGRFLGSWRPLGGILGAFGAVLGDLGWSWGDLGVVMGWSWLVLGPSWTDLGSSWLGLEPFGDDLGLAGGAKNVDFPYVFRCFLQHQFFE